MDWHKRNHVHALEGYRGLSLEERGAYTTILDLIYQRRGPIPDDMPWLAGLFGKGVTAKQARGLVNRLVRRGKLYVVDAADGAPGYMNKRAADELRRSQEASENGRRSVNERWSRRSENNDLADTTVIRSPSESESLSESPVEAETHRSSREGDSDSQDRATATRGLTVIKGSKS